MDPKYFVCDRWSVQIEEPFEFPEDESVAISDALRSHVYKMMRGTTRFLVEEEAGSNKYKKVNAIRLTCKPGRMPDETADDVCETIMQIVHVHWLDVVEQAGEIEDSANQKVRFRVVAVRTEGRKAKRTTYSFWYSTDLDEEDHEERVSIESDIMQDLLESSMRANDVKATYIEHLHETILDTLKANNQPLSAAGQLLNMAGTMATSGLQATVNALQMQYSSAKIEAEEKGKTARYNAIFGTLSPFLGMGVKQFLEHKMGKKVDLSGAMRNMGVDPEAESEDDTPSNDEVEADMRKLQEDHPIAFAAKAFGESLSPKQSLEMNKKLNKKQVEAIWDVASSDTDDEVREKITHLQGLFPPEKYPALLAMLEPQQQQLLIHIVSQVQ